MDFTLRELHESPNPEPAAFAAVRAAAAELVATLEEYIAELLA